MSSKLTCFKSSFEEEDSRKFRMAHTVTTITGSTGYKNKNNSFRLLETLYFDSNTHTELNSENVQKSKHLPQPITV